MQALRRDRIVVCGAASIMEPRGAGGGADGYGCFACHCASLQDTGQRKRRRQTYHWWRTERTADRHKSVFLPAKQLLRVVCPPTVGRAASVIAFHWHGHFQV